MVFIFQVVTPHSKSQVLLDTWHSWSAAYSTASVRTQLDTDAAASAKSTVTYILCAKFCGICISLGVSGVADTLMPK